ncbi:MAG: TonB-dependent receptor [Niveispirillum sp.]|nr:TonB-dependent receptor [Niveispirillum sp.]
MKIFEPAMRLCGCATAIALVAAIVPSALAQQSDAITLEEIVVTASRRQEKLQDVPLAVTAVSAEQLAATGVKGLTDIQYTTPGVQFGSTPNDAGFRLRGVGSAGGFASSSESPVGVVVDGVVVGFGSPVESLGDIERLEVLKGPQGTQFGKNASSGVVSVTTRRPDMKAVSGDLFASYASLDETDIHGNLNVPLAENAALAIYAFDRRYDGFVTNVVRNEEWGGTKRQGVRGKLLVEASDSFTAYLIADYSQRKQKGPGQLWTLNKVPAGDPRFNPPGVNLATLGVTPSYDNELSVENGAGNEDERNYGSSLELNWLLGDYELTSLSAWRGQDMRPSVYSIDAGPLSTFEARRKNTARSMLSQEIRLTSPQNEILEYVTGLYLSRQKVEQTGESALLRPALPFAPVTISITAGLNSGETTTESAALFGDGKLHLDEKFSILGGLRVSKDWVEASNWSERDPQLPANVTPYTPRARSTGKVNDSSLSGRIGAEYKPVDDVLLYGTYAQGYLGPTVTFSALSGTRTEVDPQTVDDFTIGAKTTLLDGRLTLNGNLFHDKYKNLQTAVLRGSEFLTENAGGLRSKGFELESNLQVTQELRLNASLAYADAVFTDYVTACPNYIQQQGAAAIAAQCNAPGSTSATPLYQAKGNSLANAPKVSYTLGANYQRDVLEGLLFDMNVNYAWRDKTYNAVGNPDTKHPAYGVVNISVGFGADDGAWRAGLFARNLFDENFKAAILATPFANVGNYVNWNVREGRRTLGVSLETRF